MERSSARMAWMLLVLCALIRPAMAQESRVLQTNASSGNGTVLTVTGLSAVGLTLTWGAGGADRVVNFEASQNTTTFVPIMCGNAETLAQATSATDTGPTTQLWRCPVSGFTRFRARVDGGTTGGVTVTVTGTTVASGGGGGSGGMNLAETDGSPSGVAWQLKVTPGSLTMNPDGTATVVMGGVGGGDVFGPAASVAGQLAIFDDNTGKVLDVATLQGTLPITVTPGVGTITLAATDAGADGATKGVATFTAADFNAALGIVSLDYTNGQKATAGQDGFLDNADFVTFAGKAPGDAPYLTTTAVAGLSGESDLGTLTTGLLKLTVAGGIATPSIAASTDVIGLWTAPCVGYLKSDGTCDAGSSSGHTIADEGTPLAQQRTVLNFAGAGVICADDTDKTTCTITGGGGGTLAMQEEDLAPNGTINTLVVPNTSLTIVGDTATLSLQTPLTASVDYATPGDLTTGLAGKENTLGFVPANSGTTLDIDGTANEIEVNVGPPQDLSTNRAWTIGIPANAQLSVAKLLNLTTNGWVKTSAGDGTLGIQETMTAADVGLGNVSNAAQLTRGAGDFSAGGIAEKAAPIGADRLLIEDSAAGNAKKYVQITNLPGTAGSKHVIKDEGGAGLTPRTNLNCVGAGITCSDDAGNDATVITVVGGGGGGGAPFAVDFLNATQIVIPATGATGHNLGTDVLVAVYDTAGKQVLCETNTPAGVVTINCSTAQSGRVVVTGGPSDALLATQRLFLHAAFGGL